MTYELELREFVTTVNLGWGAEERSVPQDVSVTVRFRFSEEPEGCESDDLSGTVDYAAVGALIKDTIRDKQFKLIEALAKQLYRGLILRFGGEGRRLSLEIHKLRPPLEGLRGGSFFRIGDF